MPTKNQIRIIQTSYNDPRWDAYVREHPDGNCYQLSGWMRAIKGAYNNGGYFLLALASDGEGSGLPGGSDRVVGVLSLMEVKNFFGGNHLVSVAFLDFGGVLADNENVERLLVQEAIKIADKKNTKYIELRHRNPLEWLKGITSKSPDISDDSGCIKLGEKSYTCTTLSRKVRMILELPESSAALMASFKSKVRSQIKKPIKDGLSVKVGGLDLLTDFYQVFSINMRDLGSPVHSRKLIENTLSEFKDESKIIVVYNGKQPIAGSVLVGFKSWLQNPWASALRQQRHLNPNMLLYWTMLEYASDNGFKFFDFGRSTPGESTYKFKEQWGCKPVPLNWYHIYLNNGQNEKKIPDKERFSKAVYFWKKLPVPLTRVIGPPIRKHISL